jgi:hypothetical protein
MFPSSIVDAMLEGPLLADLGWASYGSGGRWIGEQRADLLYLTKLSGLLASQTRYKPA